VHNLTFSSRMVNPDMPYEKSIRIHEYALLFQSKHDPNIQQAIISSLQTSSPYIKLYRQTKLISFTTSNSPSTTYKQPHYPPLVQTQHNKSICIPLKPLPQLTGYAYASDSNTCTPHGEASIVDERGLNPGEGFVGVFRVVGGEFGGFYGGG